MPAESYVELEFTDFDINFNTQLELLENGFLKPVVYELEVKFGSSYFYHDNFLIAFYMNQLVEFAIVVIENSTYFVGQYIFSSLLGPMITEFTHGYTLPFQISNPLPGQIATDNFVLDYRHTHKPFIGDGFIDMYLVGDLVFRGEICQIEPATMGFHQNGFSQLAVSESAMSCYLNQLAKSSIGQIELDEERFNQLFGTLNVQLNTQSIYEHLPIFQNKLGQNSQPMPLKLKISYSNVEVMFGQFDVDMILKYKLNIAFLIDGGRELLYDEISMITSADVESKNDIVYIKMLNNKIDARAHRKSMPVRNDMNMTQNEYREFLSTWGFTMSFMKKWMNEVVFRDGIRFPFKMEELDTELEFQEKSMHIMLEVNSKAADFFEKEFWTSKEDWI